MYGGGKKATILTKDSQAHSNSMNSIKFKSIEDDFVGLKQYQQPFLFGFAPLVGSDNDLDINATGNLIAFKYLLPVDLINKPQELYNIITQYGPQCSTITKAVESLSDEFSKNLIDNLEDNNNGMCSHAKY
jgi:hypothetical protein